MRSLISRKGIKCICLRHMSSFNRKKSKRAFLMLVTKIQRPKIFKLKKKIKKKNDLLKKKQKTAASRDEIMIPARAFSMNQSGVQAIHIEGRGHIPVSVACFNCML